MHVLSKILACLCGAVFVAACAGPEPASKAVEPTPPEVTVKKEVDTPTSNWGQVRPALIQALRAQSFEVQSHADPLKVILPLERYYGKSAEAVPESLKPKLDRLAQALVPFSGLMIKVVGHTDSIGPELKNQALSIKRAEAAVAYLVQKGVPSGFISSNGMGEAEPIASNKTEEGRQQNRRFEILIGPVQ